MQATQGRFSLKMFSTHACVMMELQTFNFRLLFFFYQLCHMAENLLHDDEPKTTAGLILSTRLPPYQSIMAIHSGGSGPVGLMECQLDVVLLAAVGAALRPELQPRFSSAVISELGFGTAIIEVPVVVVITDCVDNTTKLPDSSSLTDGPRSPPFIQMMILSSFASLTSIIAVSLFQRHKCKLI